MGEASKLNIDPNKPIGECWQRLNRDTREKIVGIIVKKSGSRKELLFMLRQKLGKFSFVITRWEKIPAEEAEKANNVGALVAPGGFLVVLTIGGEQKFSCYRPWHKANLCH